MGQEGLAGFSSDSGPTRPGLREVAGTLEKGLGLVVGGEESVLVIGDEAGGSGVVKSQYRQAAGHGLGNDIAERFGEAGEEERIGGGVVAGEVGTGTRTGEMNFGKLPGDAFPLGAVPDHDHKQVGEGLAEALVGPEGKVEIFFSGEAADIEGDGGGGGGTPLEAEVVIALVGTEESGIDTSAEEAKVGEAGGLELAQDILGGDESAEGTVVEAAQPCEDPVGEPAVTVVATVAVEVGVEAGDEGNAEAGGRADGTPAEGAFGGDVDHIGAVLAPCAEEALGGGEAKTQFGVAGNGQTGNGEEVIGVGFRGCGGLPVGTVGGDYLNAGLPFLEPVDEALQGHGDAIDFGREGFGYEGEFQNGKAVKWNSQTRPVNK